MGLTLVAVHFEATSLNANSWPVTKAVGGLSELPEKQYIVIQIRCMNRQPRVKYALELQSQGRCRDAMSRE